MLDTAVVMHACGLHNLLINEELCICAGLEACAEQWIMKARLSDLFPLIPRCVSRVVGPR